MPKRECFCLADTKKAPKTTLRPTLELGASTWPKHARFLPTGRAATLRLAKSRSVSALRGFPLDKCRSLAPPTVLPHARAAWDGSKTTREGGLARSRGLVQATPGRSRDQMESVLACWKMKTNICGLLPIYIARPNTSCTHTAPYRLFQYNFMTNALRGKKVQNDLGSAIMMLFSLNMQRELEKQRAPK